LPLLRRHYIIFAIAITPLFAFAADIIFAIISAADAAIITRYFLLSAYCFSDIFDAIDYFHDTPLLLPLRH